MNTYHVYTARMSPALYKSSALERFERSNVIEIRNRIMFDFYPATHMKMICCCKDFLSPGMGSLSDLRAQECETKQIFYEIRFILDHLVWHHDIIDCNSRGSHLYVPCRSVCNRDQNWIKRSKPFLRADQAIKVTSELWKSKDQERVAPIWPLTH